MKKHNYHKYFRVFKHDTAVDEISTNDFKPLRPQPVRMMPTVVQLRENLCALPVSPYQLLPDEATFYGYLTKAHAMRKAKAGAQRYIYFLTLLAEAGLERLLQYRTAHYEDLNINLLEANIRKVENETSLKNKYNE